MSEIDHIRTSVPTCPHCGWRDEDWWDGTSLKRDGDTKEEECQKCHKEYEVEMHYEPEFTTEKR